MTEASRDGGLVAKSRHLLESVSLHRSTIGLLLLSAAIFGATKIFHSLLDIHQPQLAFAYYAAALGAALLFVRIRYPDNAPEIRILCAGTSAVLALYIAAFDPWISHDLWLEFPVNAPLLTASRYIAIPFALLAIFRPSACLVIAATVLIEKNFTGLFFAQADVTKTDYMALVEILAFASIAIVLAQIVTAILEKRKAAPDAGYLEALRPRADFFFALFIVCVGIHFGNYFWSGIGKLLLPGGPLLWAFGNPTQILIPVTLRSGHLPIGHWPEATQAFFDLFGPAVIFVNLATVAGQIISVFAILRRNWIIGLTLFFDLTHIVIFLCSGIFFWKWILLNAVIVTAATQSRQQQYAFPVPALGAAAVVAAIPLFFTAWLAWYDTPHVNRGFFEAELRNGKRLELPSNFFGPASVVVAQDRFGSVSPVYPTRNWGTTLEDSPRARNMSCAQPAQTGPSVYPYDAESVKALVRRVMAYQDEHPGLKYDLFPHHIWSNPWLYEFTSAQVPNIARVYYVVESACVSLRDGKVTKSDARRHEELVYARE